MGPATSRVLAQATEREAVTTVPAAGLGDRFPVQGRYNRYVVRASDFALFDYAFTSTTPSPARPTGRT